MGPMNIMNKPAASWPSVQGFILGRIWQIPPFESSIEVTESLNFVILWVPFKDTPDAEIHWSGTW